MITVDVTHSNFEGHRWSEIRVSPDWTVSKLKERLYIVSGTKPGHMDLTASDRYSGQKWSLSSDEKTLEDYNIISGTDIHILDNNPEGAAIAQSLTDVTKIEKYEMSNEEYSKRTGTMREFIKKIKGDQNPLSTSNTSTVDAGAKTPEPVLTLDDVRQSHPLDHRCEVQPGGRRGEIKYVGEIAGSKGIWVGVSLDEPLGDNDGSVKGKRYFETFGNNRGCFQKPNLVLVGDYPERDPFEDLDEL